MTQFTEQEIKALKELVKDKIPASDGDWVSEIGKVAITAAPPRGWATY